jgi:hypothetical protein
MSRRKGQNPKLRIGTRNDGSQYFYFHARVSSRLQPSLGAIANIASSDSSTDGTRIKRNDFALHRRNSRGTGPKTVPIGFKWSSESSLMHQ